MPVPIRLAGRLAGAAATVALAATAVVGLPADAGAHVARVAETARATPACTDGDLTASYRSTDAGAGHRYGVLRLTNTSAHACRTGGYGGLSYVGRGDGRQVGAAATRDPGRVRSFVLRPGERARSRVDRVVAANYPRRQCRPTHVDGLRVYVPNAYRSQFVRFPARGCANPRVELLSHRPFLKA